MSFSKRVRSFFLLPKKKLNWWVSNWRESKEFRKQLIAVVLGFGIAGILWGWQCYDWTTSHNEAFTNPFSLILGALYLAIFGGLGLGWAFFRENKRKFLFLILLGIPAWLIAFLVPGIANYWLFWGGGIFLFPFYLLMSYFSEIIRFQGSLIDLAPSLVVGSLWLEFLLSGILISLFLLIFLKPKNKKYFFLPGLFFSFSSLIAPLISNLMEFYLFHSLLLSYLLTFLLISLSFALSLFKEIKYEKS